MDPVTALAAFGLVCNITQIAEQGIAIARTLHEVSKTGSTTELKALEEFNHLDASH